LKDQWLSTKSVFFSNQVEMIPTGYSFSGGEAINYNYLCIFWAHTIFVIICIIGSCVTRICHRFNTTLQCFEHVGQFPRDP
jgi:hypothetical protein